MTGAVICLGGVALGIGVASKDATRGFGADFAASLVEEFWRAVTVNGGLTVHIDLIRARNAHHAAEAIFKSGALALRMGSRITRDATFVPSTKGMLA